MEVKEVSALDKSKVYLFEINKEVPQQEVELFVAHIALAEIKGIFVTEGFAKCSEVLATDELKRTCEQILEKLNESKA